MTEDIIEIQNFLEARAMEFGAKSDNSSYIPRKNTTKEEALDDGGGFFGLISPDEEKYGPYHDFSLVIFPTTNNAAWVISLGVGSLGFKNDYELALRPGLRRLFAPLAGENGFCKTDFSDIESSIESSFMKKESIEHLKNTLHKYRKVLQVGTILEEPTSENAKKIITSYIAAYAQIRNWPTNNNQRKAVTKVISSQQVNSLVNYEEKVTSLLLERKYIILEGAPGTGKTRLASQIGNRINAKVFFTQFHAETSYSDFIYGIRPNTDSDQLIYKKSFGPFINAIDYASKNDENVILIVDEINRANLSNILGPVFYLFEHKRDLNQKIDIAPGYSLEQLPNNLFFIGTMNSSDRSLAVIDFALRRRFGWLKLKPQPIESSEFYIEDFNTFAKIFNWYANSEELNLQPGQGYFLAKGDEEMKNRIRFELYPLISEYLKEGYVASAKEEFEKYFQDRINTSLFE